MLIAISALAISACASVPLSTMLSFSRFDEKDALALQPEQISAKIQVEKPAELDLNQTKLAITASTPEGTRLFDFPLTLTAEKTIPIKPGFFSDEPAKTEYELVLSEEAINNFHSFKSMFQDTPSSQYGLSVSASFKETQDTLERIVFSIFLKLSDAQDYIQVLDNAEVDLSKGRD